MTMGSLSQGRSKLCLEEEERGGACSTTTAVELTEEMALEESGETQLECIAQLVVRSRKVERVCRDVVCALVNLRTLSLSHNLLTDVVGFEELVVLEEVNLNFNRLRNVDALGRLEQLKKAYLSNNRIESAAAFAGTTHLEVLCLYRNSLESLEVTLESLRRCGKLRSLDLDGNPCAHRPEYRHAAVKTLVRLKELDGDPVLALDRDLAREYFLQSGCSPQKGSKSFRWEALPADDFGRDVDPIATAYVANHVLETGYTEKKTKQPASFVDRLRRRAGNNSDDCCSPEDDDDERATVVSSRSEARPATAGGCAATTAVSDPYQIIRRLISLVETLQSEKTQLAAELSNVRRRTSDRGRGDDREGDDDRERDDDRGDDDDDEDGPATRHSLDGNKKSMMRELERLRVENRNMHAIRDDNATLRADVSALRLEARRASELEAENARLAARLAETRRGPADREATTEFRAAVEELRAQCDDECDDADTTEVEAPQSDPASARSAAPRVPTLDLNKPVSTGTAEARLLKAQASARNLRDHSPKIPPALAPPVPPSVAEILALRRIDDSDQAWTLAPRSARLGVVPDHGKVLPTSHSHLLYDADEEQHDNLVS